MVLLVLISAGAVSAEDDATYFDENYELDTAALLSDDGVAGADQENDIELVGANAGTQATGDFNALKAAIANGGDVYLNNSYYNFTSRITISKDCNIYGGTVDNPQGGEKATCDGHNSVQLFYINNGITANFYHITMINGNGDNGGAVFGYNGSVTAVNCIFKDNTGNNGGVIWGDVSAVNCSFINNTAQRYGGAIDSSDDVSLVNCTFIGNSAPGNGYGGGAIYSSGYMDVVNCTFINNTAPHGYGGAIWNGMGDITGVNCTFTGNSAYINGGAICSNSGSVTAENCSFINNKANQYGGAIYTIGSVTAENCTFTGNSVRNDGGAIWSGTGSVTAVNCTFTNNTETAKSGYGGGAIYSNGDTVAAVNCTFTGNSVRNDGGAIYSKNAVTAENCTFTNNSAQVSGGAIYTNDGVVTAVNCSFINNTAQRGSGGAIETYSMRDVTAVNCTFINNTAQRGSGGVIFSNKGNVAAVNCIFTNNTVGGSSGGAIYTNGGMAATNCTFTNNTSTGWGGAIFGKENVDAENCAFTDNTSSGCGGAIGTNSYVAAVNCTFTNNTSKYYGGAVYGVTGVSATNCTFTNNTSKYYGGALSAYSDYLITVVDSRFENNNAQVDGGAIYARGGLDIKNSTFVNNAASQYGSAVYNIGSMNLTGSNFIEYNVNGFATVYLQQDGNKTVNITKNIIESNLVPIYNNGSMIVSPTVLVVLDNKTYNKNLNDSIGLWAHLYDDNNNTIGSSSPIVVNVTGLKSNVDLDFNETGDMDFVADPIVLDQLGVFPVTGTYAYANNTEVLNALIDVSEFHKIVTNLTVTVANITYGEPIKGNVTLTDVDGNPIGGTVNVTAGGRSVNVTVVDGKGSFVIDEVLNVGNYPAEAEFPGDENYYASNNSTIFNVDKVNTTVSIVVENITYGEIAAGEVVVGDGLNGTATVTVDGDSFDVTVVDGKGSFTVDKVLNVGNYSAEVTFPGDINHYASNNSTIFNVDKVNTIVSIVVENITYGEIAVGEVVVGDGLNGTATVTVDGESFDVAVVDGKGSFTVEGLDAGNYTAHVVFDAGSNYNPSENSTIFNVAKINTTVSIVIENITYGDNAVGEVVVGDGLNGTATVTVDGESFDVAVVDGKGSFTVEGLDAGNYTAHVVFDAGSNYNPSENSTIFNVAKINTTVSIVIENITYGDNAAGEVVVGDGLNGTATVTVDGDSFDVDVVDGKGSFVIDKVLNVGNYSAEVTFPGDINHYASHNSTTFNVVKVNSTVSIVIENITYGDNVSGVITVGERLNGTATVTIGDMIFNVTVTDGKGVFDMESDLLPGYYPAEVTYLGDINHNPSNNDTEFNVGKIKTSISIEVEQSKDNITIIVGLPFNITDNVTVTVDNRNYTVQLVDGIGKLVIPQLPNGNYTVTAEYFGNEIYIESTSNATFAVYNNQNDDNNKTQDDENTGISEANSASTLKMTQENLKTGNPIGLLLMVLLILPLRRKLKK